MPRSRGLEDRREGATRPAPSCPKIEDRDALLDEIDVILFGDLDGRGFRFFAHIILEPVRARRVQDFGGYHAAKRRSPGSLKRQTKHSQSCSSCITAPVRCSRAAASAQSPA